MSSGIVRKAKGRPPKGSAKNAATIEVKKEPESNRKSGSMSLRPNKRVRLTKTELISDSDNEEDTFEDDGAQDSDPEDPDVEALDSAEIPADVEMEFEKSDKSNITLTEEEMKELVNRGFPVQRITEKRSRKVIIYHAKKAAKMRRKELMSKSINLSKSSITPDEELRKNIASTSYELNKEWICVGCSAEMSPSKVENLTDIFQGLTSLGTSIKDLLTSVIREDLDETMIGRRLCNSCTNQLNQIEELYSRFRSAADHFLDKYNYGQKALDADLAGIQQVSDLSSMIGVLNLPVSNIIIKVLDNSIDSFNALQVGNNDFDCKVSKIYSGSIMSEDSLPTDTLGDDGQMITITFDYATGAISRADNFSKAQMTRAQVEGRKTGVILYLVEAEFEALKKVQSENRICISIEEFSRIDPTVVLGHKTTWLQMILSSTLANEYKRQIPSTNHKFSCCDCGASFPHMHNLTNHIQTAHVQDEVNADVAVADVIPPDGKAEGRTVLDDENATSDPTRTGEVASLDKPYQCEHCDKCFAHYNNFSNHVEHYHGFCRKCNVPECDFAAKSIQEFVQHYVQHCEPNFVLPNEFKEKCTVTMPCPMCSVSMNGIWRFYNHTFIHDSTPRFKCPVCPKRLAKVQNFKTHLIKHVGSGNVKAKACADCNQLINVNDFARHLRAFHQGKLRFSCDQCNTSFSRESYLRYHREKHLPKGDWIWTCKNCAQPFPSEARLRSHESSIHQNEPVSCRHCDLDGFNSRLELKEHILQCHKKTFGCSECKMRELSVTAAREHFRSAHQDKPFKCHRCDNVYDNMIQVHHHLAHNHFTMIGDLEEGKEEYNCCVCSKTFPQALALLQHLRSSHISTTVEVINQKVPYEDIAKAFGDHIIEFKDDESEEVLKIHSIL